MRFEAIADPAGTAAAMELFNDCSAMGETLFRPFGSPEDFRSFFLRGTEDVIPVALAGEGAFASGCYAKESGKAYVTFVGVRPGCRRRGIGRAALEALEAELSALSGKRTYEISFFNPMNLTWTVPGFPGHDHPNAPGVDVSGGGYLFLKNCGYRDFAYQNSYHIDLPDYRLPEDIHSRAGALRERGIQITRYDPARHAGLEELMDSLGNPLWKKEILENAARPDGGDPLLIVDQGGRAMGFTGPLAVQPSGRGYFTGIAVHPDCRGGGAGKVLFSSLCESLRDMGAGYMTLFTGEANPARNIYEAAGFRIVRTWADMRKEIK